MPGGLQPKKGAKIAHRVLGVPKDSQGSERNVVSPRPRSHQQNLADLTLDDSQVGSFYPRSGTGIL